MTKRECSKHGLTEFTEPDANFDIMCRACKDEAIDAFMKKQQSMHHLAKAGGTYIKSILDKYLEPCTLVLTVGTANEEGTKPTTDGT